MGLHTARVIPEERFSCPPAAVHFAGVKEEIDMDKAEISTEQMLSDLKAAFPTLWARPLSEFGKAYEGQEGVWTGADGDEMPDGMPIFMTASPDPDYYDGIVNMKFIEWLGKRGWHYELYDGATVHLRPVSAFL